MLERGGFSAGFDRVDAAAREDGRGWREGRVLLERLAQEPVLPFASCLSDNEDSGGEVRGVGVDNLGRLRWYEDGA